MSKNSIYTEEMQAVLSDLLVLELNPRWSREEATILPTDKGLLLGTVLQEGTGGLEPLTTEGQPFAILARNLQKNTGDQVGLILRRGVIVNKDALCLETGVSLETTTTALNNMGIVVQ